MPGLSFCVLYSSKDKFNTKCNETYTFPAGQWQGHYCKKLFSRQTAISIPIIWALLANAHDYPRWNSTIVFS
jgi:hypothetical protein